MIYQGLDEENLDQKLPGPSVWELMQRASSSLIIHKPEMLTYQTPNLRLQWRGYVKRMPEDRITKVIMVWIPRERRKRGLLRNTWKEGV